MRRVVWLALLALTLPTAMFASTIETLTFNTGTLAGGPDSGQITGSLASGEMLNFRLIGSPDTIEVTSDILESCGDFCFEAHGGDMTVMRGGNTIFEDRLTDERLVFSTIDDSTTVAVSGILAAINGIHDGTLTGHLRFTDVTLTDLSTFPLQGSNASVLAHSEFGVIPEPGSLGLLGTGLIGLAGMARRKLKLRT